LDTWFSSALWPFSTLGYPDNTPELNYFYPTDVLVTGYDIIFFWVARMIFSGLEHTGKVPFHDVLIHGLVRDEQGRKMSKSLGNGVDPLEVINKYGADSLRHSLLMGIAPGNDTRYSDSKVEAARNYINKIWNASRFVIMNAEGQTIAKLEDVKLGAADKWIISKLENCIREVTVNLNKYELGVACDTLYSFMWDDFCDWYIELTKPALYGDDEGKKKTALAVLCFVLENALKLLHPFIPFVTEEIYSHLPTTEGSIMVAEYPRYNARRAYKKEAKSFESIMEIIKAVRNIKVEVGCPASKKVDLYLIAGDAKTKIVANKNSILKLAGANDILFVDEQSLPEKTVSHVCEICQIYIPLGELVDIEKERIRLNGELEKVMNEIQRANGKLANRNFVAKAPKKLVDEERAKLDKYIDIKEKLEKQLKTL
jgi:valyl-tRNA synthetase